MTEIQKALENARAALKAEKEKRLQAIAQGSSPAAPQNKGGMPAGIQKSLARFGCKSFDELTKINTADKKFSYVSREEMSKVKALKESVDVCILAAQALSIKTGKQYKVQDLDFYRNDLMHRVKAFGIDSGDDGYEWIPTGVSDSYIDEFNLERKVSSLFQEIRMPTDPYKYPVLSNGAVARIVGEVSALSPAQVFKTDKTIQFDSVKLTAQYALPEELNEDSAVDTVKVIRQEVIEGQEKAIEIAILEGATAGNLHYYSQLPDVAGGTLISAISNTPEIAFDGLRKRAIGASATESAGGNAITEAEMGAARKKMGKFGVNPADLAIICGPKVYAQLLNLDDVRTVDAYGAQATVLSGELAKYEGVPVIVSEWFREDLTAAGKNENGGANNLGSLCYVNRKRFFTGTRRAIQVLVEKNRTQYDVLDMVSFSRKAFQGVLVAAGTNYATESSVAFVINVGL